MKKTSYFQWYDTGGNYRKCLDSDWFYYDRIRVQQ